MLIPTATYRIQFNPDFNLESARKITPYLAELGISDIYASPIFQARAGSNHGYDIVDPNQLNSDLGTQKDLDALSHELQQYNMGWLQDIVPNHMAYDTQNKFLMDVLEHGPDSEYFSYFDINWEHPYEDIKGKILTPLLGDFYGKCLENGEIQLSYDEQGLRVNYYELKIPLRIESYAQFITHELGRLVKSLGRQHPDLIKLFGILYILKNIPTETAQKQRKDQTNFVKEILWELYRDRKDLKEFINQNLQIFNGEIGNPESFNLLDDLLKEQFFRLCFWKVGAEELNYRRFFTINELICLRIEDFTVFKNNHNLIFQLVKSGQITGLRIDHIDGLYDPEAYLQRLREELGDVYIVIEKIVELKDQYYSRTEELPNHWPIQGTSGYDFLNCLNSVFCFYQQENYRKFSDIYVNFTGIKQDYEDIVADTKRLIAETNLAGDIENLANLLKRIAGKYRYGRDFTLNGLRRAILEVLLLFPIYRTYITPDNIRESDRTYIQEVIEKAKAKIPRLVNELNFIRKILLLEYEEESLSAEDQAQWLDFVMKLQQFSGPLTAKGVEDTALYVYNRLLSLNEVGGTPDLFGIPVSVFHNFNQKCQHQWAYSINATSTHDTKRSEDVRARINVISEIPEKWEAQINHWRQLNRDHKRQINRQEIPDGNDEYFLYQTLIGAFPFTESEYPAFVERIKDYVIKAVREAKVHTAWLRPDSDYEEGFMTFVESILQPSENNQFLEKLRSFQQEIAHYGIFNSLSQTLLKITCPGVPDFYQGSELWDLSLVDPDNRRPVDFEKRAAWLQDIKQRCQTDILTLISELIATCQDGKIKLFLIARALAARNQHLDLFQQGAYIPLEVIGQYHDHIVAFARHQGDSTAIIIVPRFLTSLVEPDTFPLGQEIWADTSVEIPQGLQANWRDVITDQEMAETNSISIGQALQYFPVALLVSDRHEINS